LACDLDAFASSIPTGLAAIFLARGNVTNTRNVRALGLLLIFHLQFPPLQIPFLFLFLFLSIRELLLRHHSLHSVFQTWRSLRCKLFFTTAPHLAGKRVQGATLRRRADALETIGTDLGLAYTSATHGTSLETPRFCCASLFGTPHALLCLTDEAVMKLVRRIEMCTALSLAGLATSFAQQAQTIQRLAGGLTLRRIFTTPA
jgi:hypothetical protein